MFNIGDKVILEDGAVGYIVGMYIDPIEAIDVKWDANNKVRYSVRVYNNDYIDGYYDFGRVASNLKKA